MNERTLSGAVYSRLLQDIVDGLWAPGGKLRIELVCARYQATSTPVREALNQLASEGFVQRHEQRGFTVATADAPDLQELTDTRCWVEGLALRQAMLRASPAAEEAIVLAFHRLSRIPRSTEPDRFCDNPAWEAAHAAFHAALIAQCPSRRLRAFCTRLGEQATRYRRLANHTAYPRRNHLREHRAILQAVLAGEAERAVAALETHYRRTAAIVRGAGLGTTAERKNLCG